MGKKLERKFRDRRLTKDEAARDAEVRRKVQADFPPSHQSVALPPNSISEVLRHSIRVSEKTIDEISDAAGVPVALVARFLSGERDIHMTTADKLAESLGLKLIAD